jgi:hypothetical protein
VKERAPSLDNLLNVISYIEEAKLKWRSVTFWVGVGLGWDGKARIGRIESLAYFKSNAYASGVNTPFKDPDNPSIVRQ